MHANANVSKFIISVVSEQLTIVMQSCTHELKQQGDGDQMFRGRKITLEESSALFIEDCFRFGIDKQDSVITRRDVFTRGIFLCWGASVINFVDMKRLFTMLVCKAWHVACGELKEARLSLPANCLCKQTPVLIAMNEV